MRSVHYLPSIRLSEGGVTRAVIDLCTVLSRRGAEMTLLTCDATDAPPDWPRQGPPRAGVPRVVEIAPFGTFGLLPSEALMIAEGKIHGTDVMHLHAPWVTSNAQLAKIARRADIPYILSIHGMLDDWSMRQRGLKKRLYLALSGNQLIRHAARIHCTAQGELMQAARWIDVDRALVRPLIFDLSPYQNLPGVEPARKKFQAVRRSLDAGRRALLFLSRIHPKKGIELLIEAASRLHARGLKCDVWIAGAGDESYRAELERLAAERGLQDHVSFLGMVGGVEKLSLYQAADVFVLPTSQENFGLVLPEALACETPVVTTRGVDIWPELERAGARIVLRGVDTITAAIAELLRDAKLRDELGRRGRAWVLSDLDPDRIARDYERMYEEVAAQS